MERQVSHSVANFAAKFCNELGTDKTTICSPLSAEIVLALLALGCKNQSQAELLKALDIPDDKAIRSSFGYLTSKLQSIKGATLNVANKVYIKKGAELKSSIKKDAKDVFRSSLEQLNFNKKEAAAKTINNWVAHKTNNKITEIVSPAMFTDDTRVVMVNAIYFQGLWAKPFYVSSTESRSFHVNNSTTISVPMMSQSDAYFDYGNSPELNAKLLQMKYKGGEASMVIVLPDEIEGLKYVMEKLASGHNIMADIETMKPTEVDVMIPKFKVETTMDLKELLPKLGIKSIFEEDKAEIDMLKSNEKLFVSDAIQKALIIVDENGTEAAASTMAVMTRVCRRWESERFEANHPFLYLLAVLHMPIFIGVYEGSEYATTDVNMQVERCYRRRQRFVANQPFLYLLIARQIPLFIGVYVGSEYAQEPSADTPIAYDMANNMLKAHFQLRKLRKTN